MVQENRVHDFPSGGGQAETDVAHAQQGLDARNSLLDQTQGLDGFNGAADVVDISRAAREYQWIEHDVFSRDVPLLREQVERPPSNRQLPLAGDRLSLDRILVDGADNHGGAVLAQQRHDSLEAILAVLEIDRVHDRLALRIGEGALDGRRIGRIDHQGGLHLADQQRVERIDVRELVTVRILEIDIDDLGPVLDLRPGDLRGLLELLFGDQALESPGSDHVRALPYQQGPVSGARLDHVDAAVTGRSRRRMAARRVRRGHLGEHPDVVGRGSAAASDDVEPAVAREALQDRCEAFRRLGIESVLVWQTGVGIARDERRGGLVNRADVVRHVLRAGGAVEADSKGLGVL